MKSVNIHQAKTHLSALLARVESGEEVLIAKAGRPIARLVPIQPPAQRELGWDSGLSFWIADDFDEYLPEEFAEYVE
jgi:prevent-host-death family protein